MCSYKRFYYLDHFKNSVKCSEMGFVKLVPCECGKDVSWTSVYVDLSGYVMNECEKVKIFLVCAGIPKMWGELVLEKGKGRGRFREPKEMLAQAGAIYLRVCLEEESYFECLFKEGRGEELTEKVEEKVTEVEGATGREYIEDSVDMDENKEELEIAEVKMIHMKKDKWRQLWSVWPHIKPFNDEREYLRFDLGDLVVLPRQYYDVAENSFLLHGYHNYGHLLLAKILKKGQERICIGVPGNYYEKEAQVAVMFGFESFESKEEPVREGDFGYYMIGVAI